MPIARTYGWKPSKPDPRDFKVCAPDPIEVAHLPPLVGNLVSFPAWSQGDIGSCTGHGVGALWAHRMLAEGKSFIMPSRLFIYYGERDLEGDVAEDAGAQVRDGLKVLAASGVPPENIWPYETTKFAEKPPQAAYAAALADVALSYHSVPTAVNAVKMTLSERETLSSGASPFYASFESEDVAKTGIMPMPKPGEQCVGGHCVLWVGYDDKKQAFLVRNSWGTDWGQLGHFWMPYENIVNCSDFWTLLAVK